jgi:hypothetical protein
MRANDHYNKSASFRNRPANPHPGIRGDLSWPDRLIVQSWSATAREEFARTARGVMMAQEHMSDDFDWVGAQAKCSAALMFERLQTHVEEDVRRRNGLLGRPDGWKFEFYAEDDADVFEVSRLVGNGKVAAVVQFERVGRRIHIQGEDIDVDLTAIVTVDTSGMCRFVVGEAMYSDWELRRLALELLFFEEIEEPE